MPATHSALVYFLAGISVFLYGLSIASLNLKQLTAHRVKDLLTKLSYNPLLAATVGATITVLMQSSGAVTSMFVGLASAGVVTLNQVMGLILGSAVGSTLTIQLLSLQIAQLGLPLFCGSFILRLFFQNTTFRKVLSTLMGFGMIFWGLEIIGHSTEGLLEFSWFEQSLKLLEQRQFLTIIVAAGLAAAAHSSIVVIGFAMTLAAQGGMTFEQSIYWVYGASIGTTSVGLLASIGGNYMGRRVAWAHCIFKVVAVVLFYFMTPFFANWMDTSIPQRDIANFNTLFSLLSCGIFLLMLPQFTRFINYLIQPSPDEKAYSAKYLESADKNNPALALSCVEREIMRMGDITLRMISHSMELLAKYSPELVAEINKSDNRLDVLNKEINLYVADCMSYATSSFRKKLMRMMTVATDLESIGDVIEDGIVDLARKRHDLKIRFTKEGWEEIKEIHRTISQSAKISMNCFQLQDKKLAQKIIKQKREVRQLESDYKENHMQRLMEGNKEAIHTSSIHLDLIGELRRINSLFAHDAYMVLKEDTPDSQKKDN